MNTSKHTPGPWNRNIRAGGRYPVVYAGRNQHVATVSQQENKDEIEANIDLVSAAPELLAALDECLAIVDAHRKLTGGDGDIAAMNARAAIAKARGAA